MLASCKSGERRVDVVELLDFAEIIGKPIQFILPNSE
jgi:hypothetical protein